MGLLTSPLRFAGLALAAWIPLGADLSAQDRIYDDFTGLAGNSTQPSRFSPDSTLGDFSLTEVGKHLKLAFPPGPVDDTVLWSPDYSGSPISSPGRYLVLRYKLKTDTVPMGDGTLVFSLQWSSSQGGAFADGNKRKRYWSVPAVAGWRTMIIDLENPGASSDRNVTPCSQVPTSDEAWGAYPLHRFFLRVGWVYSPDDQQYIDSGTSTCMFDVIALVDDYDSFQKQVFADYFTGLHDRRTSNASWVWQFLAPYDVTGATTDVHWAGDTYDSADRKEHVGVLTPLIGPYDTRDPDVEEYHILLAKIAGIDGFICEWVWTGLATATPTGMDPCPIPSEPTYGTVEDNTRAVEGLASLGQAFDFEVGVNWIQQSVFDLPGLTSHTVAIARMASDLRYMLEHVYAVNGAAVKKRPLILNFAVYPSGGTHSLTGPELSNVRSGICGYNPLFLVQPYSNGSVSTDYSGFLQYIDGYFSWLTLSNPQSDPYWSSINTQNDEIAYLNTLYSGSISLMDQGKIEATTGGGVPRFDDHKGQSWHTDPHNRYLPYAQAGKATLAATLEKLAESESDTGLVVTWNDVEEASMIEPTRERGYAELEECARQVYAWKWGETFTGESLLRLPERLFRVRKALRLLTAAGYTASDLSSVTLDANLAAVKIAAGLESDAVTALSSAETAAASLLAGLTAVPVDVSLDFSDACDSSNGLTLSGCPTLPAVFNAAGVGGFALEPSVGFNITSSDLSGTGTFVGTLTLEYYDSDRAYLQVEINQASKIAAIFPMQASGTWRKSQIDLDLLDVSTTCSTLDFRIRNLSSTGALSGVHGVRIEGRVLRKP